MRELRRADVLWATAVVLLGWTWLHARDGRIRAEALAEVQADSTAAAIAAMGRRHRERDRRREAVLEARTARLADSLRHTRRQLTHLEREGESAGARLVNAADRDSTVSDSLQGLIRLTVGILNRQARACNAALASCDSLLAAKDSVIAQLDSTRVDFHQALHRTTDLWQADRRRLRRERRDLSLCAAGGPSLRGWTLLVGICYRLLPLPPW